LARAAVLTRVVLQHHSLIFLLLGVVGGQLLLEVTGPGRQAGVPVVVEGHFLAERQEPLVKVLLVVISQVMAAVVEALEALEALESEEMELVQTLLVLRLLAH